MGSVVASRRRVLGRLISEESSSSHKFRASEDYSIVNDKQTLRNSDKMQIGRLLSNA